MLHEVARVYEVSKGLSECNVESQSPSVGCSCTAVRNFNRLSSSTQAFTCTPKYTPFSCPDYCDKANVHMYFLSNVVGERSDILLLREFCGCTLSSMRLRAARNLRFASVTRTLNLLM